MVVEIHRNDDAEESTDLWHQDWHHELRQPNLARSAFDLDMVGHWVDRECLAGYNSSGQPRIRTQSTNWDHVLLRVHQEDHQPLWEKTISGRFARSRACSIVRLTRF